MSKSSSLAHEHGVKWVDLRFTDPRGKEQHVSYPASIINDELFEEGKMFDGSSIAGWKTINDSDMVLMPDDSTAIIDPFFEQPTLVLRCNIHEPATGAPYSRDPRSIATRAELFLRSTGIADTAFFGPEPEFFIFDQVRWKSTMGESILQIHSDEAHWHSDAEYADDNNLGHRPRVKGGYFPVPPVDSLHDLRAEMCEVLEELGLETEIHHHEVATAGQCEIGVKFNTLTLKADEVQILKYVVHNVAARNAKTATFMPKPLVGDNGSGMHVHQSLTKDGVNLFSGDGYAGLSQTALYYIGGIIKHARALNAFTNASTNSYRRLVPGFEAPVILAYSARNRSASIRIPFVSNPKGQRVEIRFPDPTANPYLCFSAMLMAGIDGIRNKIHPGDPADKDLYDLPPEEAKGLPTVAEDLDVALKALSEDRDFLLQGDVFNDDFIDGYINLKKHEVDQIRMAVPVEEFDLYYSV